MSIDVEVLEESFACVRPQMTEFSSSFYENLLTEYPQVQVLFKNTDMAMQQEKLVKSLVLVIDNLRQSDVLTNALRGLGRKHVQYGVLPEHYPLVGGALLKTFESYLGTEWTPTVKQAWIDAYGVISSLMLEGATYPEEILELKI